MRNIKNIAILGSTGSIGTQTLDVISEYSDRLYPYLLTANHNSELLISQALKYKPRKVVIADVSHFVAVREALAGTGIEVAAGADAIAESVADTEIDVVVTALVGYSGLAPTIRAINAGKKIALANKETLVTAGHIIMPLVKQCKVRLLPVDSEHSAIFQALNGERAQDLSRIWLTASGGPFRGRKREELKEVRAKDALKHPNWAMGRKITIDSATMVNKGLEVMEATWLFHVEAERIQVVVQPQSIVHSMVEYTDGSVIAQLGTPDMKLPIQYALYYPQRRYLPGRRLDFLTLGSITFEKPDMDTFCGLALAYEAIRTGGSMPTVYNAANERAVALFLEGRIGFLTITELIEEAMRAHRPVRDPDIDEILNIERDTYDFIEEKCRYRKEQD